MFHVEQKNMNYKNHFDILIIGGGHAGLEAAWISSSFKLKVGIVTMPNVPIASTPCNPAVGGVGKGQVVREIDALGGVMGKIADMSAIQYRTLNESKGYAVQSTRVQVDKDLYAENAEKLVEENKYITVIREPVKKIIDDEMFHVELSSGEVLTSDKTIVTTGTFLNGKLHTGEEQELGGRVDSLSSVGLEDLFSKIKVLPLRFKTGTPPRININTVDFTKMDPQESDEATHNFHWSHEPKKRFVDQVKCYLTRTTSETLDIIRDNKERSPIFNGQIKAIGPRYCPSIEDKAFRYPDRDSHHVFIEPEGLSAQTVYPNGISTSLPREIQSKFIQTIKGLEKAEISVHGYAVEYDVVDTTDLDLTLQSKAVSGLYFAGQVNGTSGYEEAAGQGLVAGMNAALSFLGRDRVILDRFESYIGVMVEDLVSQQRDEPYRLFTARSENRLYIREDNVLNRLAAYRKALGLKHNIDNFQANFMNEFNVLMNLLSSYQYQPTMKEKLYFEKNNYGPLGTNISLKELIKRSHLDPVKTLMTEVTQLGAVFLPGVIRSVAITAKYEGYVNRANQETEKQRRLGKKQLKWERLINNKNISNECRQRIEAIRPESFGQLQRIEGIRPATLAFVAGNIL